MKKLFKDFIVFIFLTFFFFSILFFLNSEKFIYKDLKLIFDVDAGASHLLSKNIKKNIEYQKKEKEYYLHILFLLLVIFLFLIIIKLLFSLKYDCKKYKICETYEDKNKSELFDLDAIREDEIQKNTDCIVKLDNQINNELFKLRRSNSVGKEDNKRERLKSKQIIEPEFESYKYDILEDYYTVAEAKQKEQKDIKNINDYVKKDKFEVADFNFNTESGKYNRSLFKRGKSLPFIKNTFVKLYGINEADKKEFSTFYDAELKKIKDVKKTPETLEKAQQEDAFISYYTKKENLMDKNERIDEALAEQAEKMNGFVNDKDRRNEDEMLKKKIAFYKEKGNEGAFVKALDTKKEKNENKKKEECKKEIIEIILGNMIKGFQNTRNELENFEIFCSKYAKYNDRKLLKSKKPNFDIIKHFKAKGGKAEGGKAEGGHDIHDIIKRFLKDKKGKDDDKMETNEGAYMFDEFVFLIQKGIYFLLHEIAKFHNLSLKVLTKTADQGVKKFANANENIKSNYIRVGEAINELQEDIYKAVEFRKRLLKGLEK